MKKSFLVTFKAKPNPNNGDGTFYNFQFSIEYPTFVRIFDAMNGKELQESIDEFMSSVKDSVSGIYPIDVQLLKID